MKEKLHRLEHRFGWNRGQVVSMTDPRGQILIGFMCNTCGIITDVHEAHHFLEAYDA